MDYFKPALPSAPRRRHSICLPAGAAQRTSPEELRLPQQAQKPGKKKCSRKKTKNLSTGRLRCFQTATLSPGGYSEFRQTCANSNRGGCKQQHDSGAGLQAVGAAGAHRGTAAPGTKQSDGNKPGLRTTQNSCCSQSK